MPYLEQDLVSSMVGSTDQKHTGKVWEFNDALLATRRVSAWLDKHTATYQDKTAKSMIFVKRGDRANLNRILREMCMRISETRAMGPAAADNNDYGWAGTAESLLAEVSEGERPRPNASICELEDTVQQV